MTTAIATQPLTTSVFLFGEDAEARGVERMTPKGFFADGGAFDRVYKK